MRMEGLEPSHTRVWQILSLLRLPFRHIRASLAKIILTYIFLFGKYQFEILEHEKI